MISLFHSATLPYLTPRHRLYFIYHDVIGYICHTIYFYGTFILIKIQIKWQEQELSKCGTVF